MANSLDPSALLNPVTWTDAGLRTLEMAVSSSQNISEEMSRLARASADSEVAPTAAASARGEPASISWVEMAADLQRSSFELMAQGWLQWVSVLNNLASFGARLPSAQGLAWQTLPMEVMRRGLLPAGWTGLRLGSAGSARQEGSGRREAGDERGAAEHALAAAAPKRHRSASRVRAKPRRSRS